MTAEEWRPAPGFPGYEVSNLGRVISKLRWRGHVGRRLLRNQHNNQGYTTLRIVAEDGTMRTVTVHKLVTAAFLGPRPAGMEVRHLDGNRGNPRLDNLCYGTPSENAHDKRRHGTDHNVAKTHCPQSHPYDDANTYITPSTGDRICRTCSAAHKAAYRDRQALRAAGIAA